MMEYDQSRSKLDVTREPIITITGTNYPGLQVGQKLSLPEAENLFPRIQYEHEQRVAQGDVNQFEVNFKIEYQRAGKKLEYNGAYYTGEGEPGLIGDIKDTTNYFLQQFESNVPPYTKWDMEKEYNELLYVRDELVPYLKMHHCMSSLETHHRNEFQEMLKAKELGKEIPDYDKLIAYHQEMLRYVDRVQKQLNTASREFRFPRMPEKELYVQAEPKSFDEVFHSKKMKLLSSQSELSMDLFHVRPNDLVEIQRKPNKYGMVIQRVLVKDINPAEKKILAEFTGKHKFLGQQEISLDSVDAIKKVAEREQYFAENYSSGSKVAVHFRNPATGEKEQLNGYAISVDNGYLRLFEAQSKQHSMSLGDIVSINQFPMERAKTKSAGLER